MAKKKTSMDTARETAATRLQVVQAVAGHSLPLSVQTTGSVLGTGKVAEPPPDTGKGRAARSARRRYRQEKLGIEDLRKATADELANAHKDPHALLTHDDIVAARDALAYSQAHGGTNQLPAGQVKVTPGKPGGPTSLGGRPVVTGAVPAAPQVLSPVRMTGGLVKGAQGAAPKTGAAAGNAAGNVSVRHDSRNTGAASRSAGYADAAVWTGLDAARGRGRRKK